MTKSVYAAVAVAASIYMLVGSQRSSLLGARDRRPATLPGRTSSSPARPSLARELNPWCWTRTLFRCLLTSRCCRGIRKESHTLDEYILIGKFLVSQLDNIWSKLFTELLNCYAIVIG